MHIRFWLQNIRILFLIDSDTQQSEFNILNYLLKNWLIKKKKKTRTYCKKNFTIRIVFAFLASGRSLTIQCACHLHSHSIGQYIWNLSIFISEQRWVYWSLQNTFNLEGYWTIAWTLKYNTFEHVGSFWYQNRCRSIPVACITLRFQKCLP